MEILKGKGMFNVTGTCQHLQCATLFEIVSFCLALKGSKSMFAVAKGN
jgi:hypothetical protein